MNIIKNLNSSKNYVKNLFSSISFEHILFHRQMTTSTVSRRLSATWDRTDVLTQERVKRVNNALCRTSGATILFMTGHISGTYSSIYNEEDNLTVESEHIDNI